MAKIKLLPKQIAASILSADFGRLNEDIASLKHHVDLIHVDVMDGHFVPNITIGPVVVKHIKSKIPLDVHLMIEDPMKYIKDFAPYAHYITVHHETCKRDLKKVIRYIKKLGCKVGVSINPHTPLSKIYGVLNEVDLVLLMTVNPGFGGQPFIKSVLHKIKYLRHICPKLNIEVDGGINPKTAKVSSYYGANIFVSGNYIFSSKRRISAIKKLRKAVEI
ncbi:MAG: ribulose-phosphate 3-epimerase, ribulose-phosphate 3-epimerase [Candidatus Peregrinibacteria bacterium GW2011_GWC2_39_14]|nr:MAG: Ribulose-phosphate 3-epimerase [Candidatus Peregrinibacteria bacterium GW2011_GWA2_38_36]KKR05871.1 MAG: ribulose-phosphate 3-epimerase, ribulose-phosphate 3-epimerase [Candidatus Peregrinibacteria bacterium GW2011_GWC2_39_14]